MTNDELRRRADSARSSLFDSRYSQQGSVILYAMLSMSVMLAIGLTLNALFVAKLRSASQSRNSIVALYVADSATELCLYESRQDVLEPNPRLPLPAGASFQIVSLPGQTDVTTDCSALGSSSFSFRATGTYLGVRRTLEVSQ